MKKNISIFGLRTSSFLKRKIFGEVGLGEICVDTWELGSKVERTSRPAIFTDGSLDLVSAFCSHREAQQELAMISGDAWVHMATRMYKLNNVWLVDGELISGKFRRRIDESRIVTSYYAMTECPVIKTAFLECSYSGNRYFGTLMKDDLGLSLVEVPTEFRVASMRPNYIHESGYRDLLNCPYPERHDFAFFKELFVCVDVGQNHYKRDRFQNLRHRMKKAVHAIGDSQKNCGVYIKRGGTGQKRVLLNEEDVESLLVKLGFCVVSPESMSADEIAVAIQDAKIVVGVEGSHLAHCVYSIASGGAVVVIQPSDRFSTAFKDFTDCLDMLFAFTVAERESNGYKVDLVDLQVILDRVGAIV